jgi:glycosyltransferase involved in cell wall biosynthesis
MTDISVIILALNEELHISRCIQNAKKITEEIFVVDCFSVDKTVDIAQELGAKIIYHAWPGLNSLQFNWALDYLPIKTNWVLKLDADEYLSEGLIEEINENLSKLPEDTSGIIMKLGRVFLNKKINYGTSGIKLLRIFRYGHGRCEQRFMDEHIKIEKGKTVEFHNELIDHNLNDLTKWTQKHLVYSKRETIDLLNKEFHLIPDHNEEVGFNNNQALKKRRLKYGYNRMPLFFRSFLYFLYRYIFRLGFLDGREGFLWHFLQGWWYRTLVDARVWQVRKACGKDPEKIKEYIRSEFGYNIP